ncbi:MAG: hypothetical protein DRP87_08630 [Spirochaetes bacterium]|nr:MAG: hypothetical protein DRP87_08630 [Spirochaetota bacterium]
MIEELEHYNGNVRTSAVKYFLLFFLPVLIVILASVFLIYGIQRKAKQEVLFINEELNITLQLELLSEHISHVCGGNYGS